MAQDRFSNEKYVDWVKVKLSLQYAKEGLEPTTEQNVETFYNSLSSRLQAPSSSSASGGPITCNSCVKADLKRQWSRQRFTCISGICDRWLNLLQQDHVDPTSTVEWDNFDVSRLPLSPWECAKVYLPYGSRKVQCAGDCDLAAILSLYLNCRHFASILQDINLCGKVKEVRNGLLHSGTMEVDRPQMMSNVGLIKQLLSDPAFAAYWACREAVAKIDQLIMFKLELSLNKELELKVLNSDIKLVASETDQLKQDMDHLTNQVQQQFGKLRTDVSGVTTEVSRMKDQLGGVTTDVSSLKDQLGGVTTDVSSLKDQLKTAVDNIVELQKVSDQLYSFINTCNIEKVDMGQLAASISTLSTMRAETDRQGQILTQLQETVGRHHVTLEQHREALKQHKGTLELHEVKLQQHSGTLEQHGGTLEQHEGTLEQHGGTLDQQRGTLEQHGGTLEQHGGTLEHHGRRLEQHEGILQQHGVVQEHSERKQLKIESDLAKTLKGVQELLRIQKAGEEGQCRVEIPILDSTVVLSGKKEEVVRLAEDVLRKVLQSAIDKVHDKEQDKSDEKDVIKAVQQFLIDLERNGGTGASTKLGSIILKIRCKTLQGLDNMLQFFRMNGLRYRLNDIENALNAMFQEELKVELVLPEDTLVLMKNWIDKCLSALSDTTSEDGAQEYKRSINLGIRCDSVEAATDVMKYLESDESAKRLKQIAEAVSEVVGDKIKVEAVPDVEGFSQALSANILSVMPSSKRETCTTDEQPPVENILHMHEEDPRRISSNISSEDSSAEKSEGAITELVMQQDRFNSGRYRSWVKTSLSLCYLKEGVTEFSNDNAAAFHKDVEQRVSLRNPQIAFKKCGSCTHKQVVKTKSKDKKSTTWRMNCRMNICSVWLEEILPYHRHQPCPDIAWKNSDTRLWPSDCWEIVKLFQPFGCQQQKRAEDCDATGLLTMIQDCSYFSKFITNPAVIQDIKQARNACMHSNDLEMSDADMTTSLNLMVAFLEEPKLKKYQSACDAALKIKQLRDNILDLALYGELELKALCNKMTEMEQNITGVKDDTKNLRDVIRNRIDNLSQDISALRLTSQKHQTTITTQYQRQQTTDRTLKTHGSLLQQHQGDIKELQQQMSGRDFKVEDLRTTLLDLYKDRLQCIPIYLIKPNWKHPVKDLYVKQNLKRVDPRGKPEHPDNPHIHQTGNQDKNKPTKDDDKNIDKVTDILFKDGKVCKDVYVTSEAGYGKTMFCAHLVRLWCDAHSKTDTDSASIDPDLANDLQSMKMFSLLFYINLSGADIPKDIKEQYEIPTLICTQLQFSEDEYIDDIKRCLEDTSTLVLMDSLDEMIATKLPARGLHNKSCIVTTSRPWKLEALRSQLQSPADYQQVEIVGLAETSPTDLVKNVLKILNKELEPDQEKKGVDFFRAIKDANLQDFLAIPVLILQILMLWYDGEQFASSQSEIYLNVVHHQILTAIKNKKLPKYYGKSERPFPLPCSSGSQCPCKEYGELLWKVASMAFHTLFGESREMCLVFDHEITSFYGLSDEEVEICLKMGILTQHKLFVKKISAEKKSVSFLHKTNQENFSAVFLSCKWSEYVKNQIFSFIKDLDRAMELDKVLLFCSQLNQDVARELSRLISVRADDDKRVQEYRQSGEYNAAPNEDLIYKIQNIVSAAVQQSIKISSAPSNALISSSQQAAEAPTPITQTRSGSTPKLIMADIILGGPQWRRTDRRLVEALDMAELKSVRINAKYADVTIWKLLEQETRSLQSLVVWNGEKTNVENIHGVVVRNLATLRTLGLHGWRLLDLSGLGKVSVMLTCDLTCLLLHNVELSHKQCVMLVQRLSEKQNLQRLTLEKITCQTHGSYRGECCDVKLQSKLEHVKLRWLPFRDVSFHTVDLKTCEIRLPFNVPAATSASNLREFTCESLRDVASVQKLVAVLPRLHGLQRIVLINIDFGSEREIQLSAAAKTLESVELWRSTITADGLESLVESVKAPRVKITLDHVTIRDRDPRDFLQRLRESPDYEVTEDRGVEYQEWRGGWLVKGCGVEEFVFYKNK